ncbi:unnamed protein product, partial [Owenia fusiformis]
YRQTPRRGVRLMMELISPQSRVQIPVIELKVAYHRVQLVQRDSIHEIRAQHTYFKSYLEVNWGQIKFMLDDAEMKLGLPSKIPIPYIERGVIDHLLHEPYVIRFYCEIDKNVFILIPKERMVV